MFVVFDLDGTLANGEHREHHITGSVKDWRAYFAACDGDTPIHPIIETMLCLYEAGHRVEIWTGRSAEVADKTDAWLHANGAGEIKILSRAENDRTQDDILKASWIAEHGKPNLVFEDRARVVAMWRSHGIKCCQVAAGDF